MSKAPIDPFERFFAKVDAFGVCWHWTGARAKNGYGVFNLGQGSGTVLAHRFAYGALLGEIPDGLQIDHRCRNRACVCPDHLEAVSQAENLRRGVGAVKTALRHASTRGGDPPSWPYVKKGRRTGEDQPDAKLTWAQVAMIRDEYGNGQATQSALAERFGVSPRVIGTVVRNEGWKVNA